MEQHHPLCDACGLPISNEREANLVRVGSCEFPFRLHQTCLPKMTLTLNLIAEWCQVTPEEILPGSREDLLTRVVNASHFA